MTFVKCFVQVLLLGAVLMESMGAVQRLRTVEPLAMHLRRLHHRSAMYGDYYQPEMMYIPAMTTLTVGDSFTGYLDPIHPQPPSGDNLCQNCNIIPQEPESPPEFPLDLEETSTVRKNEIDQGFDQETDIETETQLPDIKEVTTQKTKTKIVPKKPAHPTDVDDEDYEDWPYMMHEGRKVPPHNVFFPMMFGYSGNGRSGQNGGYPGGTTVIANSFSSGKGGVATSRATVYGRAPSVNKQDYRKRRSQQKD